MSVECLAMPGKYPPQWNPDGNVALSPVLRASLIIDEQVSFADAWRTEARLYAAVGTQLLGALDFTALQDEVHVNALYVRPDLRRLGIGSALVQNLQQRYTATSVCWSKQLGGLPVDGPWTFRRDC
jgi:ribosomal protein S18 acetylase RimI-like enzyme